MIVRYHENHKKVFPFQDDESNNVDEAEVAIWTPSEFTSYDRDDLISSNRKREFVGKNTPLKNLFKYLRKK